MNKFEKNYVFRMFGIPLVSFNYCKNWKQPEMKTGDVSTEIIPAGIDIEETVDGPVYVVNSLMLYECYKLLTKSANESLHAVTGTAHGNVLNLERIIPLRLSMQSVAGAAAASESLANELIRLNDFGLKPLAYFHSHPGYGVGATQPSGTDRQTQAMMEESGSDIIGGIFSRDGIVRFYANGGEPNVKVFGKRIREVEKNVFCMEAEKDLRE